MKKSDLLKLTTAIKNKKLSLAYLFRPTKKKDFQKVVNISDEIKLTIDYNKTIEQAVADGNFRWKNGDINSKNFPVPPEMIGKKVEVSAKLFNFNYDIGAEGVISEMEKAGYRPARVRELLALRYLIPEPREQSPIIALGSSYLDIFMGPCVPSIISDFLVDGIRCELNLFWRGGEWDHRCHFLGIRIMKEDE
jgi:hypothetical protein